jgi:enamine deaminase RidA (YjgF/YER057c/UK114 family)
VKTKITNLKVLNEAYNYKKPSSFSRGVKVFVSRQHFLFISGTASIDENGESLYVDDFRKQTERVFYNIKKLLATQKATWNNVVKTTIYIKDIAKHYDEFNVIRNEFFSKEDIRVFPASVCVQAVLCRPELLIEMEATAIVS